MLIVSLNKEAQAIYYRYFDFTLALESTELLIIVHSKLFNLKFKGSPKDLILEFKEEDRELKSFELTNDKFSCNNFMINTNTLGINDLYSLLFCKYYYISEKIY